MSATNKTTNYELPLFIGSDIPSWLTDWNGAMTSIDSYIATAVSDASGAAATAENASESAAQTVQGLVTANNTIATIQQNIATIQNKLTFTTVNMKASGGISGLATCAIIKNSDASICKLIIKLNNVSGWTNNIALGSSGLYVHASVQINGNQFNISDGGYMALGPIMSITGENPQLQDLYLIYSGGITYIGHASNGASYPSAVTLGGTLIVFQTGQVITL